MKLLFLHCNDKGSKGEKKVKCERANPEHVLLIIIMKFYWCIHIIKKEERENETKLNH